MKLLIAEDEPFVREGLKKIINSMDLGIHICGEAEDGTDALPLIATLRPDIVMTDIKMIDMNGLDLIRMVRESDGIQPRFIILSAFHDFDFARQAMRFNVQHYLLKPIDPHELRSCLEEVMAELTAEQEQKADARENAWTALRSMTLRFLKNGASLAVSEKLRLRWQAPEKAIFLCAVVLADAGADTAAMHKQQEAGNEAALTYESALHRSILGLESTLDGVAGDLPDGLMENLPEDMLWQGILQDGPMCWIHVSAWNLNCRNASVRMEDILRSSFRSFKRTMGAGLVALLGDPVQGFSVLHEAYRSAVEISEHRYLASPFDVLVTSRIRSRTLHYGLNDLPDISLITDPLFAKDLPLAETAVENVFLRFQASATAPDCIRAYVNELGLRVMRRLQKCNGDVEAFVLRHRQMLSFEPRSQSLSELRRKTLLFCEDANLCLKSLELASPGSLIVRIREYVDQHYKEDINVQSIAAAFFINPSYLGQTYKRTTGFFLNEYINRRRMEEAKRFLRTTDLKVYQIAGLVGFNNPDYFVSKFVSSEGVTPLQFRKGMKEG